MHRRLAGACLLTTVLWGATPAWAQQDAYDTWRRDVDTLLSRWSDVEGGRRLARAAEILVRYLREESGQGHARLELARLELARDNCRAAITAADQARDRFAELIAEREGQDDEVVMRLREQWRQSLALGFLAQNYRVQQGLERISEPEESEAFLREHGPNVAARRQALMDAFPTAELVQVSLSAEKEHRQALRDLERLGVEPRPLAQTDQEGEYVDFTRYGGHVVLVLFWSVEAPAADGAVQLEECAAVVDEVNALQKEFADRLLVVVGVNLDRDREVFDAFVEKHELSGWRHLFSGEGWANGDAMAWGVQSVPSGALIDHTGHVRYLDPWGPNLRLSIEDLLTRRDEGK